MAKAAEQDGEPDVDAALRALAHSARRRILRLVRDGELSSSELADRCGLPRPATSQHLRTLREADLVTVRIADGRRLYRTRRERLARLLVALDAFWDGRLGALSAALAEDARAGDEPGPRGDAGAGRAGGVEVGPAA